MRIEIGTSALFQKAYIQPLAQWISEYEMRVTADMLAIMLPERRR